MFLMKHIASLIINLRNEVFVSNDDGLENICKTFMDTLKSFGPIKKKYARGNQMHSMTKNLSKYTQQRNKCVSLLR